jgi:DNA-binding protein HU-beta
MTKAEIIKEISQNTGIEKVTVGKAVEAFMETMKDSLTGGSNVYLRGFGSFIVKKRAEKTARNISKNTTVIVPAHNIPSFKPAKEFVTQVKEQVNKKNSGRTKPMRLQNVRFTPFKRTSVPAILIKDSCTPC